MQKTILLTGGAGYIGSHVAKMLHENGYDIAVLDDLSTGHEEFVKWGNYFYLGRCGDKELVKNILIETNPDCVIHLAGSAYVSESIYNPLKYYNNNLIETIGLLDVMKETGHKKIIFSSSCATYGIPKILPIVENAEQSPISPYGKTKLYIENMIKDYSHAYGFNYVFFRYFNACGADESLKIGERHLPETHIIPLILDVCLGKKDSIDVFGYDLPTQDGTCVRDFVHVNDLADAHVKSISKILNNENGIFNLGKNVCSIKELIKVCENVTGKLVSVNYLPPRIGDPSVLYADYSRAVEELNWTPKYNIENIVKTAWEWHTK